MSKQNIEGSVESRVCFEQLEDWVREKIQGWVQELLEEEVTELLGRGKSERRRAVDTPSGYRNGFGKPRHLTMSSGTIQVRRPRVRDLEERFESRVLPLFAKRTRQVRELIPELYLHGLALGDFDLALRGLLGDKAALSASTVARLKEKWQAEWEVWQSRPLNDLEVVYLWVDWRQLEFPATTNGIPRFFRADPDHEGMVKDQQVRRLVKLKKNEKTLTMAAAKAGMSRKTARKYLKSGKLPSQCQPERYWRTRSDPFESVWPEVKEILKRSPTVEAKAVFDHLCRQQEGAFQQGQLRTLQRRIKQWKAEYGEAKEVMFPQKYQPGHQAQSDFTFMGRLGVTIQGQPFPHLLYHFVLAYSNWEATTLCFSESFESLSLGLQNALWELGALPEEHRTDRLSAAVKNLKREEFTERYQALLRHFGMRSSRTQAGKAHENGDVEQSHHRLKRAIEQELLLRCSRDFSSREEYEGFVAMMVARRNAARQKRLGEELAVMRPLPARRLDDFTRQWVRVSPSSTIRVRHNTYSVNSRLIGERVQVRVWADQVEVYYGGRRQARMPRLRGEGKHRIDYRHVIHSLVRKPGAFTRYRWREDLFPGILFRVAYDELRRDCPATADRQYLKILEVAAQEGEQRVREALQVLIERGQRIRFEALRECLVDPVVEPWEVMVEKMDVGLYDTLLENREVRS